MRSQALLSALRISTTMGLVLCLAQTATAEPAGFSATGDLVLDEITLRHRSGKAGMYDQSRASDRIDADTISHFRGQSPADIFRGVPGVRSGEARNAGGAIDVNIRGLQGMGRIETTVDGMSNNMTIYQGYQGLSNRSYVDPDFLAGVEISKGADISSAGIGGSVAMRTLSADDIIPEGRNWGLRVKGGFTNNTSTPITGYKAGYEVRNSPNAAPQISGDPRGLDRPALFQPSSGYGSIIGAWRQGGFNALLGFSHRDQGNYHAGTNGPAARFESDGPTKLCTSWGSCTEYPFGYATNRGDSSFRAGEVVPNTSSRVSSALMKLGYDFGAGHSLLLTYNGMRSEAGDRLASLLVHDGVRSVQQPYRFGMGLDSASLTYGWRPADTGLFDLQARLWGTRLDLRTPDRYGWNRDPNTPPDYRYRQINKRFGLDVTNTARMTLADRALTVKSGLFWHHEDQEPRRDPKGYWMPTNLPDAVSETAGLYVDADWVASDRLTLRGGLRFEHYHTHDRSDTSRVSSFSRPYYGRTRSGDMWSGSIGATYALTPDADLYANVTSRARAPGLLSIDAGFVKSDADLHHERSRSVEIGANLRRAGLLSQDDQALLKLGAFHTEIDGFITREWVQKDYQMRLFNQHKATFQGVELNGSYSRGGFTAELAANYYTKVRFCRTADTCEEKSLYADYATNQIPPEYSVDLTLTQKLMDDRLTVGGRISHVSRRAIGHGDSTGSGMSDYITKIDWKPHTIVDAFAEYKVSDGLQAEIGVQNLFDRFYTDPLSLVNQPAPGRTVNASVSYTF